MGRLNHKLNAVEDKKQYRVEIAKKFAALEILKDESQEKHRIPVLGNKSI